jgi:hypothetical protein
MIILRLALLPLLVVLAVDCFPLLCASTGSPAAPDHETVEEHWPDGKLRLRKQVLRLEDGTTVDDGSFERWYDDGTMEYTAVFVRGKKEGTTIRYHRNGRIASRQQYHDGERHGLSENWDDQGRKVKEENWADGRPDGTWTIWKNGEVEWTHDFEHVDPDPETTRRGNHEEAPQCSMGDPDPVPDSDGPDVDRGRQQPSTRER